MTDREFIYTMVFVGADAKIERTGELIRCKDCKHRPTVNGEYEDGYDIEFPNFMKCPCECEDGWYNWMPKDDWYCANAERKEERGE